MVKIQRVKKRTQATDPRLVELGELDWLVGQLRETLIGLTVMQRKSHTLYRWWWGMGTSLASLLHQTEEQYASRLSAVQIGLKVTPEEQMSFLCDCTICSMSYTDELDCADGH